MTEMSVRTYTANKFVNLRDWKDFETCAELSEAGTLSGEDVIPGFTCPVAELFV